jgi:hypothetical protein
MGALLPGLRRPLAVRLPGSIASLPSPDMAAASMPPVPAREKMPIKASPGHQTVPRVPSRHWHLTAAKASGGRAGSRRRGESVRGPWTLCPPTYLAYTSRVPRMYLSRPETRLTCEYAWQEQAGALGAIPVEAAETFRPGRAQVRGGVPALRGQREDHGRSTVLELEPGHRPPTTPPPARPRSQGRHQPKSPAAFGVVVGRAKFRHPGAAAIGNLHPDDAAADPDRERDRLSRIARPAVSNTVTKQLAH